jgi:hypothetical protein
MRCEPVNICDPQTDGHLVVMHPGQGVHVVLPAVAPTPHLYSDFLVQTGHVTLGDTRVYQYVQRAAARRRRTRPNTRASAPTATS